MSIFVKPDLLLVGPSLHVLGRIECVQGWTLPVAAPSSIIAEKQEPPANTSYYSQSETFGLSPHSETAQVLGKHFIKKKGCATDDPGHRQALLSGRVRVNIRETASALDSVGDPPLPPINTPDVLRLSRSGMTSFALLSQVLSIPLCRSRV